MMMIMVVMMNLYLTHKEPVFILKYYFIIIIFKRE